MRRRKGENYKMLRTAIENQQSEASSISQKLWAEGRC